MAAIETNTRKIIARLEREGWKKVGGGKHDKFEHPDKPGAFITVPRHRELPMGGRLAGLQGPQGGSSVRMMMRYYVAILDGAGDVWGVSIPDLPGCFGGGATPEEAIADATTAAREWAECQAARGVPPPRTVQEVMADPDAEFNPAAGESLVMISLGDVASALSDYQGGQPGGDTQGA